MGPILVTLESFRESAVPWNRYLMNPEQTRRRRLVKFRSSFGWIFWSSSEHDRYWWFYWSWWVCCGLGQIRGNMENLMILVRGFNHSNSFLCLDQWEFMRASSLKRSPHCLGIGSRTSVQHNYKQGKQPKTPNVQNKSQACWDEAWPGRASQLCVALPVCRAHALAWT